MASARTLAWIERLTWVLLYGGIVCAILGAATLRFDPVQASVLLVGGGAAALAGLVLIIVRSRLHQDASVAAAPRTPEKPSQR